MSHELDRFLARVRDRSGQSDAAAVEVAARATLRMLGTHLGGVPPALQDALPRPLRPVFVAGEGGDPVRPAELYQQVADLANVRVGMALELVLSTIAELAGSLDEHALDVLKGLLPPAWAALVTTPTEPREASRPLPSAKLNDGSGMYKLGDGSGAHKLSDGSGAHKLGDGSGAYKLSDGSGAHRLTDGSGAHKLSDGSGAYKLGDGSGAHRLTDASGAYRLSDGSGAHRLTDGSGAHKLSDGSGAHRLTDGSGAHKLSTGRPGSSRPLADAQPPAGQADSVAATDDPHPDRLAASRGPEPRDGATLAKGRPGRRRRTLIDTE